MKTVRKLIPILLATVLSCALFTGCGSSAPAQAPAQAQSPAQAQAAKAELRIAYQYGLAYAPLILCQKNGLLEKAYKEKTGNELTVVWNQMSSGADINTGFASGSLDIGFMGIAPAITGISKNVGYKIFTNLSGQEHGLMTNDPEISGFDDIIGSSSQIALVNTGSIQHIILAKALSENGYDAHVLDSNIVAMKHPDGMSTVESGSVACHLTSNPYIYKERDNSDLHEIEAVKSAWPADNSFIVGVASQDLHEKDPALYDAVCSAFGAAIDMINGDMEGSAKITCEFNGNTPEDELKYMKAGSYGAETKGVLSLAKFMFANGFVEKDFENYSDLVFDNVSGD